MRLLSSLGELRTGFQLRGAAKHTETGAHTLIQLGDVREDSVENNRLIRMDLGRARERDFVASGDLLLRSRGASYRAALVSDVLPKTVAATPLYVFRVTSPEILPSYLAWFLNRPETQGLLAGQARGSYIPTVGIEAFSNLEIVVPPLAEQRHIIEVDALVRREKALTARLAGERERLAQALLEKILLPHREKGDHHEG